MAIDILGLFGTTVISKKIYIQIHISKWLLNNRIEAQVEYDCDADAEPLQINDEETDETKAEGSKEEEEKSDPVPA